MSTHAIVAVKRKDGSYLAKHSHYGSYEDYGYDIKRACYDEFLDSILQGNSSEPFNGSYLDLRYCVGNCHWTEDMFFESMPSHCPKRFDDIDKLFKYAYDNFADYIYIKHEDESLDIYDYRSMGYMDMFEEINSIEEIDLSTLHGMTDDELHNVLEESLDFDDLIHDECIHDEVDDILAEYALDFNDISALDRDEVIDAIERYNQALPKIKSALKGGI